MGKYLKLTKLKEKTMENLNKHREAMATALNTVDGLFNSLQVTHREKEVARERFAECNYWLSRLYARIEQEYAARVEAANVAIEALPVEEKKEATKPKKKK